MSLTCAALLLALSNPSNAGQTLILAPGQDCPTIKVSKAFDPPVTVLANGSAIHGLQIAGGGVSWYGGTIDAPKGVTGAAADGYGVKIASASRVSIQQATITGAKKAMVVDKSTDINVSNNTFIRYREDGMIVSDTQRLTIIGNSFTDQSPVPTTCTAPSGISYGLSNAACTALGGTWADGDHGDAVQMRDNVTDAYLAENIVRGPTQGLDEMAGATDRPLARITIDHNDIQTDAYHQITLGDAITDSMIRWNTVRHADGSTKKAIIRPGGAYVCGNTVPDLVSGKSTAGPAC